MRWEIQREGVLTSCPPTPTPQRGQLKGHGLGGAEVGGEIREEGKLYHLSLDFILSAGELIGLVKLGRD